MEKPIYNQVANPKTFNFNNDVFMARIKSVYAKEKAEHDAKKNISTKAVTQ